MAWDGEGGCYCHLASQWQWHRPACHALWSRASRKPREGTVPSHCDLSAQAHTYVVSCYVMVQLKKLIQGTITARAGCTHVKEPCKLGRLQQHVATGENVCTFQQSTAKHKLECREALCRVGVLTSYKPFLSWKVTSVGAVSRGCTCPPPLLLVTTHRLPKPHLSPHIHAYADTQSVLSMHLLGDWYLARHVSESNAYAEMQALNA